MYKKTDNINKWAVKMTVCECASMGWDGADIEMYIKWFETKYNFNKKMGRIAAAAAAATYVVFINVNCSKNDNYY